MEMRLAFIPIPLVISVFRVRNLSIDAIPEIADYFHAVIILFQDEKICGWPSRVRSDSVNAARQFAAKGVVNESGVLRELNGQGFSRLQGFCRNLVPAHQVIRTDTELPGD